METLFAAADHIQHIRVCLRCGSRYDWRRSPSSSLKMTYCGSLCESADLGFIIEALLIVERRHVIGIPALFA